MKHIAPPAFCPARRRALQTGLVFAAFAAIPGLAGADPFMVEVAQNSDPNPARADGDIIEVAGAAGQFTTFLRAVRAAGYEETLRGSGPFTVFAPTDDAFAQMRRADLNRLMQPLAHEELLALLSYHVAPGRLTSATLNGRLTHARSASGYNIDLDGRDGLRVNDQLVVLPDLDARNGVIQGVNTVLSPPVLVASR